MKHAVLVALPIAAACLAVVFNVPQSLGAHPWWSDTVVWIGLPLGVGIAAFVHWLALRHGAMIMTVCMAASYGLAAFGKARFVASYADDVLAGRIWYFGWIGVAICATAAVTLAIWTLAVWSRPRSRDTRPS